MPRRFRSLAIIMLAALAGAGAWAGVAAQTSERYFPETGQTVRGRFLAYWNAHGGLAQQGYPISSEFPELSPTDGKTYTVQYFERAVFEYHPENAGTPYEVLLSLAGVDAYKARYPRGAPGQHPRAAGVFFPETGYQLGGSFRTYWETHGGLAQQGYPISDEFTEVSALDGKEYTVQYFERAVFEYHPENKGNPYEVLLAQLGTYRYQALYKGISLPGPLPGRVQRNPRGSDRYLVWSEEAVSGDLPPGKIIRGFDLAARRALTITAAAGDYPVYDISGSIVVWDEKEAGCVPNCTRGDIRGQDLATGQTFAIATGPGLRYGPAIGGRTAAWVEINNGTAQLMMKDLDAATPTVITSTTSTQSPYFYDGYGAVYVSPQFIVWTTVSSRSAGSNTYSYASIYAYNRQTGATQDIASYGGDHYYQGPWLRGYALDGEQLFWFAGGLQLANLRTGERRQVFGEPERYGDSPAVLRGVRGNVVYWTAGPLVNGWRLDRPGVVNLVSDPGLITQATIAGEWLVWNTCDSYEAQGCGPLRAAPLADLFAANRPPPTYAPPSPSPTPTPPPTAEPPLPTIGAGGPAIPSPRPGYDQYYPMGSANYLVWTERLANPASGGAQIRALNVATSQVITLATGLENYDFPQVDGSVAVWADETRKQILAHDLASGQRYTLPAGPGWEHSLAVSGRDVAWVEREVATGGTRTSRILRQTLGAPAPQPVVTLVSGLPEGTVIGEVALSPAVLAWFEVSEVGQSPPTLVRAQDRATGNIATIVATPPDDPYVYGLVVDGTTIYWVGRQVYAVDVRDQARTIRTLSDGGANRGLRVGNGIVAWNSTHPRGNGIWGRRLPAGAPRRLTDQVGDFALVGPWLIYDGPGPKLEVVRWGDRLP